MNAFLVLLDGLHESRRLQAERELRRYAHLISDAHGHGQPLAITAAPDPEGAPQLEGAPSMAGIPA
jgi:hypothetical protein